MVKYLDAIDVFLFEISILHTYLMKMKFHNACFYEAASNATIISISLKIPYIFMIQAWHTFLVRGHGPTSNVFGPPRNLWFSHFPTPGNSIFLHIVLQKSYCFARNLVQLVKERFSPQSEGIFNGQILFSCIKTYTGPKPLYFNWLPKFPKIN